MSAVTYYSGTVYSADTLNGSTHYGIPTHTINGLTFRSEGEYVYLSPVISNSVYITYTNNNTGRVNYSTYTKINDYYVENCTNNPFNFKTDNINIIFFGMFLGDINVPIKVTIQFN